MAVGDDHNLQQIELKEMALISKKEIVNARGKSAA
jgi:hypothetical protein